MRKIEKEMLRFIAAKRNYTNGNTSVRIEGERINVFLHGNKIATIIRSWEGSWSGRSITFCLCGWPTVTTRSRLNALFQLVANRRIRIYQEGYGQYLNKDGVIFRIDSNKSYKLCNRWMERGCDLSGITTIPI